MSQVPSPLGKGAMKTPSNQSALEPDPLDIPAEALPLYHAYLNSPYSSIKHSTYFQVYRDLFDAYRGKRFTFVEVGVLNGGSLFMWRDYFGHQARIIGIDLNPEAARWRDHGFEIYLGNQADPSFWRNFFAEIGKVDVVLDDGGHTFEQQIVTSNECIPNISDGGKLIVEDTHTSYLKDFGYPSRYTFIEWTKTVIDHIHQRFPGIAISEMRHERYVYSIRYFESMVCFEIDRRKCVQSQPTTNQGVSFQAADLRYAGTSDERLGAIQAKLASRFKLLKHIPFLWMIGQRISASLSKRMVRNRGAKAKKYF